MATRSRSSATVSKRVMTRASGIRKSQQAKQFFKLASELRHSEEPTERQRLKKKLARLTFGESLPAPRNHCRFELAESENRTVGASDFVAFLRSLILPPACFRVTCCKTSTYSLFCEDGWKSKYPVVSAPGISTSIWELYAESVLIFCVYCHSAPLYSSRKGTSEVHTAESPTFLKCR